jgi:hypothetical protein
MNLRLHYKYAITTSHNTCTDVGTICINGGSCLTALRHIDLLQLLAQLQGSKTCLLFDKAMEMRLILEM